MPADSVRDAIVTAHYAAKAVAKDTVPSWDTAHDSPAMTERTRAAGDAARADEYAAQSRLLRDLIGNPFRPVFSDRCGATGDPGRARRPPST